MNTGTSAGYRANRHQDRQSPVAPQTLEYHLELQRKSFLTEGVVKEAEEIIADLEMEMHQVNSRADR